MKTVRFLVILTLLFSFTTMEATDTPSERRNIALEKHKRDTGKSRPRAPQRYSSVECYYENGMISIQFEIPEGDATFTVTDVVTGDNASTTFNTAVEFSYYIGTEPSTYLLEINTSAGNTYEGYLTLE